MYQCQGEEFAGLGTCRCLSTSLWVWLCQRGHWYWSSLQADSVVSCSVRKSITIVGLSTATPSNQATILPSRPSCSKSDIIATGPTINLLKQVDAKRLRARCNRTPQPKPCKHSTNKAQKNAKPLSWHAQEWIDQLRHHQGIPCKVESNVSDATPKLWALCGSLYSLKSR